jgi:hypothetical protein
MSLALPSWVVPLLAATAGLVFLRVVDNRRINRLLRANVAQTTSRTETP